MRIMSQERILISVPDRRFPIFPPRIDLVFGDFNTAHIFLKLVTPYEHSVADFASVLKRMDISELFSFIYHMA